jgi:hypothetical protein
MSIPFCELSLTGLLSFPVLVPSPIGMELVEVSTSLLHTSFSLRGSDKGGSRYFAWIYSKFGRSDSKWCQLRSSVADFVAKFRMI